MAHIKQMEREIIVDRDGIRDATRTESVLPVRIVEFILGVVEVVLGLRFLLKLFGANPNSGFASFVYDVTSPLTAPFRAVFGTTVEQGAVFEWSTLLAMAVYALVAWGVIRLIDMAMRPTEGFS